jgi:hypothetical protein
MGWLGTSARHKKRKKSRRRPGGQKGHDGAHRTLLDVEQVNEIIPVLPSECKHCGHALPQRPEEM